MTFRSHLLAGLLAVGAFAAAAPATAAPCNNNPQVVGEACYVVNSKGGGDASDQPTSFTTSAEFGDVYGYAEANDLNGGTAIARVSTNQGAFVRAEASVAWLIMPELNPGQVGDDLIPMRARAVASWGFNGASGGGNAFFGLQQGGRTLFSGDYSTPILPGTIFTIDQIFWVRPDVPIRVDIQAITSTRQGFNSSSEVITDPFFEIVGDYAARYTLKGLLGNAAPPTGAVPEPATWAMMILGLGAAGATLRRRRAQMALS